MNSEGAHALYGHRQQWVEHEQTDGADADVAREAA
jgi:hypothetical protein